MKKQWLVVFLLFVLSDCYSQWQTSWRVTADDGQHDDDYFHDMARDNSGNLFLFGNQVLTGNLYEDLLISKFDANGILLWQQAYSRPGDRQEFAWSAMVDQNGDVILGGFQKDLSNVNDIMVLKYSSSGQLLWADSLPEANYYSDAFNNFCLDVAGNVYVTGYSQPGVGGYIQGRLIKYSPQGQLLQAMVYPWLKSVDRITYYNGRLYVGANTGTPSTNEHSKFYKMDLNGNILDSLTIADANANHINCVTAGNDGIFVVDAKSDPFGTTPSSYAIYKLDTLFNLSWTSPTSSVANHRPVKLCSMDTMVVVGSDDWSSGDAITQIVSFGKKAGSVINQTTFSSPTQTFGVLYDMYVDTQDNVIVGRVTNGNSGSGSVNQIVRFDATLQNQTELDLPGDGNAYHLKLAPVDDFTVYVGSNVYDSLTGDSNYALYKIHDVSQSVHDMITRQLKAYPVPFKENLFLSKPMDQPTKWEVLNMEGQYIAGGLLKTGEDEIKLKLSAGVYILWLRNNSGQLASKIISD